MVSRMSRVAGMAIVGVPILLFGGAGCGGSPPAASEATTLVATSDPDTFVEVQSPAAKNQAWLHGSFTVCLEEPGKATVTSVSFETGELEITDWLVRPNPAAGGREFAGDVPGTLEDLEVEDATTTLTRVCDKSGASSYEVVLELASGKVSSIGRNVVVEYTSGGERKELLMLDRVALCIKPDRPNCF